MSWRKLCWPSANAYDTKRKLFWESLISFSSFQLTCRTILEGTWALALLQSSSLAPPAWISLWIGRNRVCYTTADTATLSAKLGRTACVVWWLPDRSILWDENWKCNISRGWIKVSWHLASCVVTTVVVEMATWEATPTLMSISLMDMMGWSMWWWTATLKPSPGCETRN